MQRNGFILFGWKITKLCNMALGQIVFLVMVSNCMKFHEIRLNTFEVKDKAKVFSQ